MKTLFNELTISSFNPSAFWILNRYSFLSSNVYCNSLNDASTYHDASAKIVYYFENKSPLALNHWIGILRITKKDGGFDQFFISVVAGKTDALNIIETKAMEKLIMSGYLNNINNKIEFLNDSLISDIYNNEKMFDFIGDFTKLETYKS